MSAPLVPGRPSHDDVLLAKAYAVELEREYGHLQGRALLDVIIGDVLRGDIALVSSFGTEAAVLLALVAEVDPATPVLFLDTGMHFPEPLQYRDSLMEQLGLTDVRTVDPSPLDAGAHDPDGRLWARNPNLCCYLRKVLPLERALGGFGSWITGRKQFQGASRGTLPAIEAASGRIKVNPLVTWTPADIAREYERRGLPPHPLVAAGYSSVGCAPCTRPVATGEEPRAGRWSGSNKSECGIHVGEDDAAVAPAAAE